MAGKPNCKRCLKPKSQCKCGRPTVMTEEVIRKLERVFSYGASDREASLYAGITPATLYKYCNEHPEFSERKELLKDKPILRAREIVITGMEEDPSLAFKYLERKRKEEFAVRTELTGKEGDAIQHDVLGEEAKKRLKKYKK
jgi:hypothetical protein